MENFLFILFFLVVTGVKASFPILPFPTTHNKSNDHKPEIYLIKGCQKRSSHDELSIVNCNPRGGQRLHVFGVNIPLNAKIYLERSNDLVRFICLDDRALRVQLHVEFQCRLPESAAGATYNLIVTSMTGVNVVLSSAITYATEAEYWDGDSGKELSNLWEGIGGLKNQLEEIRRRIFTVRSGPNREVFRKLSIRQIRGILLYGPPGTGKTLIARKIGKMIHAKSVKVVLGPSVMSKYVGESENNIRSLFSRAELDYKQNGIYAGIHVIVFDEMDSMMRHRGLGEDTAARAVYDGVTTQLLTILDGFDSLPNILVIGLTNRYETIDSALLRPGRFEVKLKIPVPDHDGRLEILRIHSHSMQQMGLLHPSVNLEAISRITAGFTGADLEGLIRSALSKAIKRNSKTSEEQISLHQHDFIQSVKETFRSYKANHSPLRHITNGIVSFGARFDDIVRKFDNLVKIASRKGVMRILLEGPSETGLSALGSYLAARSNSATITILSKATMLQNVSWKKLDELRAAIELVESSNTTTVVIDTLDVFLELGEKQLTSHEKHITSIIAVMRNLELQAIKLHRVRLNKENESRENRFVLVIATTNSFPVLESIDVLSAFDAVLHVPCLRRDEQIGVLSELKVENRLGVVQTAALLPYEVPIKQLFRIISTALLPKEIHPVSSMQSHPGPQYEFVPLHRDLFEELWFECWSQLVYNSTVHSDDVSTDSSNRSEMQMHSFDPDRFFETLDDSKLNTVSGVDSFIGWAEDLLDSP